MAARAHSICPICRGWGYLFRRDIGDETVPIVYYRVVCNCVMEAEKIIKEVKKEDEKLIVETSEKIEEVWKKIDRENERRYEMLSRQIAIIERNKKNRKGRYAKKT